MTTADMIYFSWLIRRGEEMKVYVIQLFATKSEEEALKLFKSLKSKGLPVRIDKVNDWYKIRIGNFKSYEEAKKAFLDYNLENKGYITFIDYEPSRTILKSEERVNNDESSNQTVLQITTSEQYKRTYDDRDSTSFEEEKFSENSTSEYESLNKTEKAVSVFDEPTHKQVAEKKERTTFITGERKEEGMNFWGIVPLLILVVLFMLIVKLILRRMKKGNNSEVKATMQSATKKLPKEENKEMKREKEKEKAGRVTDVGKKQPVSFEEKGSILSYGKLVIGESAFLNGNINSKDAIIVGDNSTLKGTVKAEKYVKLGKNVKSGKITAPIVHTIRNEEVPKVPQTETPIAGGIKSSGDLELSDGLLIQGNVEVDGNLKIGKKSKIFGNVVAKRVIIDEGTFISGKVSAHQDVELKNGVIVGTAPGKGEVIAGGTVKIGSSVAVFGNVDAKQIVTE
jgi:predicted acyltransferase (DUF342 family)